MILNLDGKELTVPEGTEKINIFYDKEEQEVNSFMSNGEEIVFCNADANGDYVGWTPRSTAIAKGYKPATVTIQKLAYGFEGGKDD